MTDAPPRPSPAPVASRAHAVFILVMNRPVRTGLVLAAVVMVGVGALTVRSLGHIEAQLGRENRAYTVPGASHADDRRAFLANHVDVIGDVRRLYRAFVTGVATALGLLILAYWLAERATASRHLVQRQQAIIGKTHEAMVHIDLDGVIRDYNAAARAMLGYAPGEIIGHPYLEFILPESRAHAGEAFARSVEQGSAYIEGLRTARRDGSVAIMDFSTLLLTGEPPIVIAIGRDMTDKHAAAVDLAASQEQLRQAQKMEAIGLLAGGVAHDFNNALTVINGYSELILDRLPELDPNRDRMVEINKAGLRAADITRQLLTFSRRQRSRLAVLDLNATIRDTAKMLQRLVGEDVALTTRLAPGLGRILADAGHVQQVLMNLAVNARDAMPGGGRLTITTEMAAAKSPAGMDGSVVRLTFEDTGCGMDAQTQARVFEPFFTTKEVGKGTGLGLSIIFGIVKDAGGVIGIRSSPGHGAAFVIDLPEVVTVPSVETASPALQGPTDSKGTLLIVEDDGQLRTFAEDILSARGYTVLAAEDGGAALARSRDYPQTIDLVVSDLVMPGLPVEEMIAALRRDRPAIRLLFISGYSDRARLHPLLAHGSVPFLEKPFTFPELESMIGKILAEPAPAGVAA